MLFFFFQKTRLRVISAPNEAVLEALMMFSRVHREKKERAKNARKGTYVILVNKV